jgi:CrcB protein
MTLSSIAFTGLIGLAGAMGALMRYVLGRFVAERISSSFPLGTMLINVSGAFLIGLIFVTASRHLISSSVQVVLATGFLGGYTTFSTMSWEGVQLIRGGSRWTSVLYLGGTVALGLLVVVLGFGLGRVI